MDVNYEESFSLALCFKTITTVVPICEYDTSFHKVHIMGLPEVRSWKMASLLG